MSAQVRVRSSSKARQEFTPCGIPCSPTSRLWMHRVGSETDANRPLIEQNPTAKPLQRLLGGIRLWIGPIPPGNPLLCEPFITANTSRIIAVPPLILWVTECWKCWNRLFLSFAYQQPQIVSVLPVQGVNRIVLGSKLQSGIHGLFQGCWWGGLRFTALQGKRSGLSLLCCCQGNPGADRLSRVRGTSDLCLETASIPPSKTHCPHH